MDTARAKGFSSCTSTDISFLHNASIRLPEAYTNEKQGNNLLYQLLVGIRTSDKRVRGSTEGFSPALIAATSWSLATSRGLTYLQMEDRWIM